MAPKKLAGHRVEYSKDDIQQPKVLVKTRTPMTEIGNQVPARAGENREQITRHARRQFTA